MIAILLGLLAAGLGVAVGAPWWTLLCAAPFLVPGRWGPALGAILVAAVLPWGAGALWKDAILLAIGVCLGWGALYRLGRAVPWVAVPWWAIGFLVLEILWRVLPPTGFWSGSDVAVRARLLVLAALACVGLAVHYLPRYRNVPSLAPPPGERGGGTEGGRDETR